MPGVIGAFVGREEAERYGDEAADLLVVTRAGGAQERFEFGEREFDRIEIRTVGREESQVRAHLLDRHPDLGLLMHPEVVQHDDISRSQRGHQHLFDVGEETRTIDRPIKDRWGAETLEPQRGNHRVGFPMTAGRVVREPQAARTPAVAPEEIGGNAALIEKDVLPHVAERLPRAPVTPLSGDVGAALFVGVYGFF